MTAALCGSLIGLGGGVILVPAMLFLQQYAEAFSWATPQVIVGISLVAMTFTAMASTISYARKGRVDYKTGFLFIAGSLPGGVLGSWLNQYVNAEQFQLYFGILMIVMSLLFLMKHKQPKMLMGGSPKGVRTFHLNGRIYHYKVSAWLAFCISLAVGTLSGMFGIGGGAIMVPAMILLFGMPAHIAAATSMFMILFVSMMSAGTHIVLGHVAWAYVFFFIPGAWIGGTIGAKVNQHLKGKTLVRILRLMLVFIGLRLIFEGLS